MNENEQNRAILSKHILKLIDDELDKEDCDMELVDRYNAILDDIDRSNCAPDKKRKKQALAELDRAYKEAASKQEKLAKNPIKIKRRFNFLNWKIAVAACLCFIIVTPLAVSAFSGSTPIELIESLGSKIFRMERNTPYDFGEITFIRSGETIIYESVEELLKQENINILYPSWLPGETKIESVRITNSTEGDVVLFKFDSDAIMFSVRLYNTDLSIYKENPEYMLKTFNGIECFIRNGENIGYSIIFVCDNYTYHMSIENIEELPLIMENLKQGE